MVVWWLRFHLQMQGVQTWTLVRSYKSHDNTPPQPKKTKAENRSNIVANSSLKILKMVHIKRKFLKNLIWWHLKDWYLWIFALWGYLSGVDSSGYDSMLPRQEAHIRSPSREPHPTCHKICSPQRPFFKFLFFYILFETCLLYLPATHSCCTSSRAPGNRSILCITAVLQIS